MSSIRLTGLTKRFGDVTAVDSVDLTIDSGDLYFLLGPSGCGKTTLLRMIAGFIEPTAGRIFFGEKDVTDLPPNKRNTGMVFQSYALWPHMTVADNVGYGLAVRKVSTAQKRQEVIKALQTVQMERFADRKPTQLSGGQQQRVALARALVIEPTVLLLDEPLSNLDAKLRLEMRSEIRRICSETGITTVYVTHDQKEALSMADSMAVLKDGKVMQVGPPRQLYTRPATHFVSDFLGETNFIAATVRSLNGTTVELDTAVGPLTSTALPDAEIAPPLDVGDSVTCSIRPEALKIVTDRAGTNQLTGTRSSTMYLGEVAQHLVDVAGKARLKVLELNPAPAAEAAASLTLAVNPADVVILGADPPGVESVHNR